MGVPTNTFQTYASIGNREDLSDTIYNIAPTDTPFMSMCDKTKASAVFHEWQTESLTAVDTSNAQIEGDDSTADAATPTVRIGNRCQISKKVISVSGTQDAISKAGRKSELAHQIALKGKELKRDMEAIVTRNQASVTGSASVARKLGSVESWLTTNDSRGAGGSDGGYSASNTVAATNGTQRAFTETLLKSVLQLCYSSGGDPDIIMLGPVNKQNFSTFTGNATKTKEVDDKKTIAAVDVYVGDFGTLKVVPNRFQNDRTGLVLESDMWAIASLRPFMIEDLAKTGDSNKKQLLTEYTLVCRNEAANGVIADLTTS